MKRSRLSLALKDGALDLPEGPVAVFNPPAGTDLSALDAENLTLIQRFKPDFDTWQASGRKVVTQADGRFAMAIVFIPRAKDAARALVAEAAAVTDGPVIVDGQKTDGIEPLLKALRSRADVGGTLSKAHGKLAWVTGGDFTGWEAADRTLEGGFITRPGVFSADGPDKGSQVLAASLPDRLKGKAADLGAGWGFLSCKVLTCPGVTALDLIEADLVALDCARRNVEDPRARFIWADVTAHKPDAAYDFIVSNPPFHTGRAGDPALGRAFISAAAAMLAPQGRLWLVANRHLPYEDTLRKAFHQVEEVGDTPGFKVLHAIRPRRQKR